MLESSNQSKLKRLSGLSVRLALTLAVTAGLCAPALAQRAADSGDRVESAVFNRPSEASPIKPRVHVGLSSPRTVPYVGTPRREAVASAALGTVVPRQLAQGEDVPALADAAKTAAMMDWKPTQQGGLLASIAVGQGTSMGMRLGVVVSALPRTAILRFYGANANTALEVPAAEVLDTLARTASTGDRTETGRTYWGPLVENAAALLELELPAGVQAAEVAIAVPKVSVFFDLPNAFDGRESLKAIGDSGSCNIDVACTTAGSAVDAVARMVFTAATGGSYLCSGTLLNNRANDGKPYFLTANHCISKASEAASLITYWFYRASFCNSRVLDSRSTVLSGGAALLYASSATDTSFLLLNRNPPATARYAGWDASTPLLSSAVTGLHFPQGDLEKISTGSISTFRACTDSAADGTYSCSNSTAALGGYFNVAYTQGTVEGGSSGSGVFTTISGTQYLVGQLRGGTSSCSNPTGVNTYGRFDRAYSAALAQYLGGSTSAVLSIAKSGVGSGTVTSAPTGLACGATCSRVFPVGSSVVLTAAPAPGSSFGGWTGPCTGTAPICSIVLSTSSQVGAVFNRLPQTIDVALDMPGTVFTNDPVAPFFSQFSQFNFGGSAVQTASIGNGKTTTLSMVVRGPGILFFDWKVSSEVNRDYFTFSGISNSILSISGNTDWISQGHYIPAGTYQVRWTYSKDASLSSGQDAAWLDHIFFTSNTSYMNLTLNPSFERGTANWVVSSSGVWLPFISKFTDATSDINANLLNLCYYNKCNESVSQIFTIPADASKAVLQFDWTTFTDEIASASVYDQMVAELYDAITGVKLKVISSISNTNLNLIWKFVFSDITEYAGRVLKLVFKAVTDFSAPTAFYLDSVQLMVTGTGGVEAGFWWNPNESGRGFVMEKRGSNVFLSGFLYDLNGKATWFSANGPVIGDQFSAPMVTYSSGQTLVGRYVAPQEIRGTQQIRMIFSDPRNAVLTWPGGSINIQRFNIIPGGVSAPALATAPEKGIWWNPAESGRGFVIETQGDSLFMGGFMYEADGSPVWYATSGKMSTPSSYNGKWLKYGGGQPMVGAYRAPSSTAEVASVTINFIGTKNAQILLPSGSVPITRFTGF